MRERDYYRILGAPRNASKDEIRDAYRKLALQYHPDRNKSPLAGEKFREISEAYAILSDDAKREQYNQYVDSGIEGSYNSQDMFIEVDSGDIFPEYQMDFAYREEVNASKPDGSYLFPSGVAVRLIVVITLMATLYLLYGSRQVIWGAGEYQQLYHILYYMAEMTLAAIGVGYVMKSVSKKARQETV
jgi:DnaJ-class molecular chaperone